ncbi:hypothetical protein AB0P15_29100 [Streptomyces sp. NPDC087917]|uniref:hypothetical protein n=1 Tax=Streptomyces sp. NPDC087917 TaxID=3155060 RepID=UPI0034260F1E
MNDSTAEERTGRQKPLLTEDLDMSRDLDLGGRTEALEQCGVNRFAHAAIVAAVRDVLPETQVGLLVGSRLGPGAAPPHDGGRTDF